MATGNIIRVVKHEKYAVISQAMLRDSRLSFAARGLLAYLLSKPSDWTMQTEDLIAQSPAGRDAVYSMLKELETCGYLKRERVRDAKGHVSWETTVYEVPGLAPITASPNTAQPDTDKPDTVQPNTGKPDVKKDRKKELSISAQPTVSQSTTKKNQTALGQLKPDERQILEAWFGLTRRYPNVATWAYILSRLKKDFDSKRFFRCGGAYIANNGLGQKHVAGICDWYVENLTAPRNGGPPRKQDDKALSAAEIDAMRDREANARRTA